MKRLDIRPVEGGSNAVVYDDNGDIAMMIDYDRAAGWWGYAWLNDDSADPIRVRMDPEACPQVLAALLGAA